MASFAGMDLSIVIPVYNEQENVSLLYQRNKQVLDKVRRDYEIIFVDDGSTDNTFRELQKIHAKDKKVKIIKFRGNFGQTAALDAGFKLAKGDIIVAMDGDLQNDPADIPRLLEKMQEGHDVVSGWRYPRKDPLMKHILSRCADKLRRFITGERIHDSGCTLKAYRKECFENLDLYGEMHRFIPALLLWKGFKIAEIKVQHHPRKYGRTNYNVLRLVKGFLDLLVVKFWMQYSARPIHLFGGLGLLLTLLGFLAGVYLSYQRLFLMIPIGGRPLLLLAVLLIILGVQCIIFGLITDILIKIYFGEGNRAYTIEKVLE